MITKEMESIIREAIWVDQLTQEELSKVFIQSVYIINTEQAYNGFWGANGYNNIMLVGYSSDDKYYVLSDKQCDVVHLWKTNSPYISIDIPEDFNCIRIFGFSQPLMLANSCSSATLTSQEEYAKLYSQEEDIKLTED